MRTIICLLISNCFMTFAWYGGGFMQKQVAGTSMWKLVLVSWGVAFLEYCFMVPANNLFGPAEGFSPFQLKTIQEIVSLTVFVLFAVFALNQPFRWNYLVAFACIIAAACFMFMPQAGR